MLSSASAEAVRPSSEGSATDDADLGGALGSLAVLFLARRVPTPLPWLRLDALLLLLVWCASVAWR